MDFFGKLKDTLPPEELSEGATKCPFCGTVVNGRTDFRDELSWKEHKISRLCQSCQDDFFKEED